MSALPRPARSSSGASGSAPRRTSCRGTQSPHPNTPKSTQSRAHPRTGIRFQEKISGIPLHELRRRKVFLTFVRQPFAAAVKPSKSTSQSQEHFISPSPITVATRQPAIIPREYFFIQHTFASRHTFTRTADPVSFQINLDAPCGSIRTKVLHFQFLISGGVSFFSVARSEKWMTNFGNTKEKPLTACVYGCIIKSSNTVGVSKMFNRVAVLGSRDLNQSFAPQVGYVVAGLQREGVPAWSSCCGRGACAFARAAFAHQSLASVSVFRASAFPASSFSGSLCLRSAACVRGVSVSGAVVVFLSSPGSVGSCKEMRLAASLGVPVFAFACGFVPALLPSLGAGVWVAVAAPSPLFGAWQWCAAQGQPQLFV